MGSQRKVGLLKISFREELFFLHDPQRYPVQLQRQSDSIVSARGLRRCAGFKKQIPRPGESNTMEHDLSQCRWRIRRRG